MFVKEGMLGFPPERMEEMPETTVAVVRALIIHPVEATRRAIAQALRQGGPPRIADHDS